MAALKLKTLCLGDHFYLSTCNPYVYEKLMDIEFEVINKFGTCFECISEDINCFIIALHENVNVILVEE